ncbi:MAG TPA: DUF6476 family protein [Stellaceae bacterium]|jgi:Flp pilus assembly protein CpaB|nr:DUF6476 family protein [Stellaceae bacterium]
MRGLRVLVIVLGVLLVGGTLGLVVAIIARAPHPSESRPEARASVSSKRAPFETILDLPAGAVIQSVQLGGTQLAVHLVLPEGNQQIVILDPGSGARVGTIEFRPAR